MDLILIARTESGQRLFCYYAERQPGGNSRSYDVVVLGFGAVRAKLDADVVSGNCHCGGGPG